MLYLINRYKQRVTDIITVHKEATEKSQREEEWQLERLRSAIQQLKKDHSEQNASTENVSVSGPQAIQHVATTQS